MGWSKPILTDSGGFQVFSLRDTIAAVDDDGVTFRNVYDGAAARFTPETVAAAIQREPRQRHRDVPRPGAAAGRLARRARGAPSGGRPSGRAASASAERADGQLRFAIVQGGTDRELRRRSLEELVELDFDGNAIGGLAIGEDRDVMFETTDWLAPQLPAEQAALLHGDRRSRGDPRDDRGRRRHVRLRPPDPHRPHRQRAHLGGAPQPPQRPLRARPGAARRGLRLPRVHDLLARLHPAPREPGGAARAPAALAPQSTLRPRADPPRARGDRAGRRSARTSGTRSSVSAGSTWAT